jgi:alpha-beta hydrolase superfamily lysophospholipase
MKLVILILAGGYVLVSAIAFFLQARLVYMPDRVEAGTPDDAGMEYRDVFFSSGGKELHGWFVTSPGARYTMLYCHGNAGNISWRVELIRAFVERGLNVFIFDYRGFGKSGGKPGEKETYEDAHAAWDYLTREEGIDGKDIILFGRSLGSAIAIELATTVSPRGIILESPFISMPELAGRAYPLLPARFLCRYRYNSWNRVLEVDCPKLFAHSLDDDLVPYGMGKRLYNRAQRPKMWTRANGDHNAIYLVPGSRYESVFRDFIASLDQPRIGRGVDG